MSRSEDSNDRVELSRLFVQCEKKCPKILADFGASLQSSGGTEGEHALVEVDLSGLAWTAGFRNHDVIEAVNAAELKMKDVCHRSLVEYLREDGQTCSVLIRRHRKKGTNFYWIAYRVKIKDGEPIIAEKVKLSIGNDIIHAESFHVKLPEWARRIAFSPLVLTYESTVRVRLPIEQTSGSVYYLGFFVKSEVCEPRFTTEDFVLNMRKYQSVYKPTKEQLVAFSATPKRIGLRLRESGCFDILFQKEDKDNNDDNDDDGDDDDGDDDDGDDEEVCLSGDVKGPMQITRFPATMIGSGKILVNPKVFALHLNDDGTFTISTADCDEEKLYVSYTNGKVYLAETGSTFQLTPEISPS